MSVTVKGRGVLAINSSYSFSFLTSWNTRGNSPPPPATSVLIQQSRIACAIWNSPLQLCSRSDPQIHAGYFDKIDLFWCSAFFNRDLCFFIMVCPTISKTTENMVCLKMTSSCMETWVNSMWVKMDRKQTYPSSLYYFVVFLTFLFIYSIKIWYLFQSNSRCMLLCIYSFML